MNNHCLWDLHWDLPNEINHLASESPFSLKSLHRQQIHGKWNQTINVNTVWRLLVAVIYLHSSSAKWCSAYLYHWRVLEERIWPLSVKIGEIFTFTGKIYILLIFDKNQMESLPCHLRQSCVSFSWSHLGANQRQTLIRWRKISNGKVGENWV